MRNPPPICVGIPHLQKYASICIDIYNVTWSQKVGACLKFDAKLEGLVVKEVPVGCFYYPLHIDSKLGLFYKWLKLNLHSKRFLENFKFSWINNKEKETVLL